MNQKNIFNIRSILNPILFSALIISLISERQRFIWPMDKRGMKNGIISGSLSAVIKLKWGTFMILNLFVSSACSLQVLMIRLFAVLQDWNWCATNGASTIIFLIQPAI